MAFLRRPGGDLFAHDSPSRFRHAGLCANWRGSFCCFGGFSGRSVAGSKDAASALIITADEGVRAGRRIPLKANVDAAIDKLSSSQSLTQKVIVVHRTGAPVEMIKGRDFLRRRENQSLKRLSLFRLSSEDPLFILYTSGSTGKPKGVLHTTAGYLVHVSLTHELIFDYRAGDIYWCTC